jgi:hypothetical protein
MKGLPLSRHTSSERAAGRLMSQPGPPRVNDTEAS